jgi:phosphopantothenate-cysteine ligase
MTTIAIQTPAPPDLPPVPAMDTNLNLKLQSFCFQHSSHNRPICLVSSGGTVADLEVRTVRSLENFSTGLRGALSVEQLLDRGYAVIHLWRTGSASPFGRTMAQAIGLNGNQGLSTAALNRLLENEDDHDEEGHVETVPEDPWTAEETNKPAAASTTAGDSTNNNHSGSLQLHHRLSNDEHLQRAWRQWRSSKGRLITIPFRSVEEYLTRLKECSMILNESSQSLGMIYLAAAVSDYYVPDKVEHKIQSSENPDELILKLQSVPKVMGLLRNEWAPNAYVVSFKLETDSAILRHKAERAVMKYGVHMVVGNILETRHATVHVLYNKNILGDGDDETTTSVQDWTMQEISKPSSGGILEAELIEFCVQQHFDFISQHFSPEHAALKTHERLLQRKKELQRQLFFKTLKDGVLQLGGAVIGMGITYIISMAIQRRIMYAK